MYCKPQSFAPSIARLRWPVRGLATLTSDSTKARVLVMADRAQSLCRDASHRLHGVASMQYVRSGQRYRTGMVNLKSSEGQGSLHEYDIYLGQRMTRSQGPFADPESRRFTDSRASPTISSFLSLCHHPHNPKHRYHPHEEMAATESPASPPRSPTFPPLSPYWTPVNQRSESSNESFPRTYSVKEWEMQGRQAPEGWVKLDEEIPSVEDKADEEGFELVSEQHHRLQAALETHVDI